MRPTLQIFWTIVYKLFPIIRDTLLTLRIIWHSKKRQPFPVGYLKEGITRKECRQYLRESGFERNVIAWVDHGEMISMRKIDPIQPDYHYHIRIFEDGEIRGHYEKMPERHPIDHFRERGMMNRADYFRSIMSEMIVGVTVSPYSTCDILNKEDDFDSGSTKSHSAPAVSRGVPTRG